MATDLLIQFRVFLFRFLLRIFSTERCCNFCLATQRRFTPILYDVKQIFKKNSTIIFWNFSFFICIQFTQIPFHISIFLQYYNLTKKIRYDLKISIFYSLEIQLTSCLYYSRNLYLFKQLFSDPFRAWFPVFIFLVFRVFIFIFYFFCICNFLDILLAIIDIIITI